jgi:hypothetical protein
MAHYLTGSLLDKQVQHCSWVSKIEDSAIEWHSIHGLWFFIEIMQALHAPFIAVKLYVYFLESSNAHCLIPLLAARAVSLLTGRCVVCWQSIGQIYNVYNIIVKGPI